MQYKYCDLFFNTQTMSLFETLLEIKTGEKNLMIKAVYMPHTTA